MQLFAHPFLWSFQLQPGSPASKSASLVRVSALLGPAHRGTVTIKVTVAVAVPRPARHSHCDSDFGCRRPPVTVCRDPLLRT